MNVHQNIHQQHRLQRLPILPPFQWDHKLVGQTDNVGGSDIIGTTRGSSNSPPVKEIEWSNKNTMNQCINDDDDDISISLDLGVENYLTVEQSYRDLSSISSIDVAHTIDDSDKRCIFPVLLHMIISSGGHEDSIAWTLSGRAFAIIDKDKFFAEVCHLYFCTKDCKKFMEWIKVYRFQKVKYYDENKNEMAVAFYHEVRVNCGYHAVGLLLTFFFVIVKLWFPVAILLHYRMIHIEIPPLLALASITESIRIAQQIFYDFRYLPPLEDVNISLHLRVRALARTITSAL